jgi:hypothetical protein
MLFAMPRVVFFLKRRSHSISFTRAQCVPKYKFFLSRHGSLRECLRMSLCLPCPALPPTLASCAWPANLAIESALAITDLDLSNNHIGLGGLKVAPPSVPGTQSFARRRQTM